MVRKCNEAVCRQVRNREEVEQAFELVHDNYVASGYMSPQPSGLRLSVHNAMPTTRTFVSLLQEEIVATVTLFCDSSLGLPLDSLYSREIGALREEGRYLSEVGMLADRRWQLSQSVSLLMEMMKCMFWAAKEGGLSDLLITVNPKHKKFYKRFLCFEEYGGEKRYGAVRGAPAVLLRLDLLKLTAERVPRETVRKLFFGDPPQGADLQRGYRMCPEDIDYFFLERTDVLRFASSETVRAIESQYAGLGLRATRIASAA